MPNGGLISKSTGGIWLKRQGFKIAAAATITVDIVPVSVFQSLKYIIVGYNIVENKRKHLEISIIKDGAGFKSQARGIINSGISMDVDELLSGSNMVLDITNNNAFEIKVDFAKLKLG